MNNADVSAQLVIGSNPTNRTVRYSGLQSNTFYTARITVTDSYGRVTVLNLRFDTLSANLLTIEMEDYNYGVDSLGNRVLGVCLPIDPVPSISSGRGFQNKPPPSGFDPFLNPVNGNGTG